MFKTPYHPYLRNPLTWSYKLPIVDIQSQITEQQLVRILIRQQKTEVCIYLLGCSKQSQEFENLVF